MRKIFLMKPSSYKPVLAVFILAASNSWNLVSGADLINHATKPVVSSEQDIRIIGIDGNLSDKVVLSRDDTLVCAILSKKTVNKIVADHAKSGSMAHNVNDMLKNGSNEKKTENKELEGTSKPSESGSVTSTSTSEKKENLNDRNSPNSSDHSTSELSSHSNVSNNDSKTNLANNAVKENGNAIENVVLNGSTHTKDETNPPAKIVDMSHEAHFETGAAPGCHSEQCNITNEASKSKEISGDVNKTTSVGSSSKLVAENPTEPATGITSNPENSVNNPKESSIVETSKNNSSDGDSSKVNSTNDSSTIGASTINSSVQESQLKHTNSNIGTAETITPEKSFIDGSENKVKTNDVDEANKVAALTSVDSEKLKNLMDLTSVMKIGKN